MLDTLLMSSKAWKISKGTGQFIKNSGNEDTYLMANPETTSHIRRSPLRHWSTASSR